MQILPSPDQLSDFAKLAFDSVTSGKWQAVAALALVAAVWAVRKFVAPKVPFFGTDAGGAVMLLGTSALGGLATALLAGGALSGPMLWAAVAVAVKAAGGWTLAKRLLPLAYPVLAKLGFPTLLDAHAAKEEAVQAGKDAAAAVKARSPLDVINGGKQ